MSTFEEFWGATPGEVRQEFPYGTLPGSSMHLGEIGIIDRGGYLGIGKLSDLYDIDFKSEPV